MRQSLLTGLVLAVALVSPAVAGHNNPWATSTDVILSKNHDDNQVQSVDTPGEDEMNGTMVQSAHGKTGGAASGGAPGGQGQGAGAGRG